MDTDTFKANMKTLHELIFDEYKVVTYISLSKELCIHANEAKSLLSQFVKDIRQSKPEAKIYVCYMISGLLDNNNGLTAVCSEKETEALKNTLKTVFYEHVYCVSRGMKSVDSVSLSTINNFDDFSLCTGLIKANTCIKRKDNELVDLITKNHAAIINNDQKPLKVQPKNLKDKSKEFITNSLKDKVKEVSIDLPKDKIKDIAVNSQVNETNIKTEIISPKKAVSKSSPKKNGTKTATKSIAGFFNKANNESKNNIKIQEAETKTDSVKKCVNNTDGKVTPVVVSNGVNSKDKSKNKDSLSQIKKTAKVDKKRKRLLQVSDSESDAEENDPFKNDMDVDCESEDEIPPTPTNNTVKITSGLINPKKKRKVVDKTYTDEEGYILTKKVEVYESCSDNEEETKENNLQEKQNSIKESNKESKDCKSKQPLVVEIKHVKSETSPKETSKNKRKKITPSKGKQSTINSFFKKA